MRVDVKLSSGVPATVSRTSASAACPPPRDARLRHLVRLFTILRRMWPIDGNSAGREATCAAVSHPLFARIYARTSLSIDRELVGHRKRLLAGLSGRVLELGAGNGLNFAHYPSEVASVVAVEPEPYLRQIAERNARSAAAPIEVIDGVGEQLALEEGGFDAAVVSLVLCSVRDQHAALRELYRVLRPGGELRFFEHVRADTTGLQRFQHVLDTTVWPALMGGCHTGRDTHAAIQSAGFNIEQLERFHLPDVRFPIPTAPHVIGTAWRP
jgi:ubiquinone/menaquinone biosynthesis C-methylase UbiE